MRGFKALGGARVLCRAPAFLRNLGGRSYDLEPMSARVTAPPGSPVLRAWKVLTATLLVG